MKLTKEFSSLVSIMLKYDGDCPKQKALRDYVRLAITMARKYTRSRVAYEDIVMEGITGLMEAVDKFDPSRSTDFKTYAITRMKGRMYQYCLANKSLVHIPTHIANTVAHVERMIKALDKEPRIGTDPINIIKVYEHPEEDLLSKHTLKFIRSCKSKICKLANNSRTDYEKLTEQAILALISGNEAGEDEISGEDTYSIDNDVGSAYEFSIFLEEKEDDLRKAMGPRKLFTLKLKMQGYNYKDIAKKLFQAGYTDREVSRQAVKGSLEKAKKVLIDEGFTREK